MADNMNVRRGNTFFSSDDEGDDKPRKAREAVLTYRQEILGESRADLTLGDIYVVWFTYVLGNWKALVSTTVPDGRYFEVTFKRENDGSDGPSEMYVDEYQKMNNERFVVS